MVGIKVEGLHLLPVFQLQGKRITSRSVTALYGAWLNCRDSLGENMTNKLSIFTPIIMLLFATFSFSAEDAESLRYAVCQKNVRHADIGHGKDQYSVTIRLTVAATKEFANLTGNNIGKRLTIVAGDMVVTSAIIKDTIGSGSIGSLPMTEQAALKLQQFILNSTESQCGLVK